MTTNQSTTKNSSTLLVAVLLTLQIWFWATTPTAAQTPPPPGTYFSMQLTNVPPMPYDPLPGLDIYADPSGPAGTYYYDDRDVDYSSDATSLSSGRFAAMSADDPTPPGDGGGSTNSIVPAITPYRAADGYTPCVSWTNFWLLVSNGTGGITVTVSNTLAGLQYVLLQKQTLTDASWTSVQTVTATDSSTQFYAITPGTNATLFFQAKLTNYLAPVIITPPTNVVVATGSAASFQVVADGNPAVSYQWSLNGTNISGATTSAYNIGSADAANAGLYTVVVSNAICTASASAYLGLSWSQYLTNAISSSPSVNPVDGTIYITTFGSELMAVDPIDGHVEWTASVPTGGSGALSSSPAVASDGSAVYVGGSDGLLYAFSANGAPLWTHYTDDYIYSSPAVSATDGTIYVLLYGGYSATLRAVNPTTGATNWIFAARDISTTGIVHGDSSPAIAQDGTIYFLTSSGDYPTPSGGLYAVHPDGSLAWFFPLPTEDAPEGSPAIDADGNVIVGSSDGYLYCISHSGGLRWIFDTSLFNTGTASAINASPAIGPDSTIYIASQDGNIYAITNGGMKWKFTTTSPYGALPFVASPAVTSSNVVFVGTSDSSGGFYGIADGIQKTNYSTAANVYSSAAIDPFDGGIIVADMAGYIYKFPGVGDFPTDAPWPMFHRTPSHAGAVPAATVVNGGVTVFPNNPSLDLLNGMFTFYLSGTPGTSWAIYASTNLIDWSPIGGVLVDKNYGWGSFQDSEISGVTNRFYQARSSFGCSQIFGFTLQTFGPQSTNLVANPFYQVNHGDYPQNTAQGLTTLMANSSFDPLPNGVEIQKWNGTDFDSVTWNVVQVSWSPNGDLSLLPGKSFFIINPSTNSITVPFVGNLAPGTSTNRISVGTNYVSSLFPRAGRISTDLGFAPNDGDQLTLLRTNGSFTSSYSSSTGWSPSEPSIALAEGFVLNTTQPNNWIRYSPGCLSSNLFAVTANPLWTDTGLTVTNGDTIFFSAYGAWSGAGGVVTGPEGSSPDQYYDMFVNGQQFSLVAFVGPDPFSDAGGTNHWGDSSYFPQQSGTNGYWMVGATGSFTTDRTGKLWLGCNDDARTMATDDNYGELYGELQVVHPGP